MSNQDQTQAVINTLKVRAFDLQEQVNQFGSILELAAQKLVAKDLDDLVAKLNEMPDPESEEE